jgi:hypothetical protein
MPVYVVELDGKQYDIEGDRPPNEAEARAVVQDFTSKYGGAQSAEFLHSPRPAFSPEHTDSIGPAPWYQQHNIPGTNVELPFSVEDAAEALPAAVGTGAALLATKNPGVAGTVGGMTGEAARQLFRRAVGAPAATGVAQRALHLDPNSPEAAAAGLGGEALAGVAGGVVSKGAKALSGVATDSAERAIVRDILGGARTEREIMEAPRLAKRAQAAGIIKKWTQKGRLATAQSALNTATADAAAKTNAARAAGATVEAGPVLDAIQNELPSSIPGPVGMPRRAAGAERRAASRVLNDEIDAVINTGGGPTGTAVPLDVTFGEIDALDAQLEAMYRRGALDPALGKSATKAGVDSWRAQLHAALPEVADARLTKHELITITEMMKRHLAERFSARGAGHPVAGVAGSAAVGRYSPASASLFSAVAGKLAPLTIPGRQIAAKLLSGGAKTAQLWVRAADLAGLNKTIEDQIKDIERNRRAQQALQTQAQGVIAP